MLEAKPCAPSSSGATTWDEDEVAEIERHIGELTSEHKAFRQEAKGNSTEYARNKGTVANMRGKFTELREARDLLKAARAENEDLKATLAEERANSLPGIEVPLFDIRRDSSKRGAPFDPYFEDTIAPAMLNTGSTLEQINEIIRKPQFNTHHTHPPTHTHTHTPTHTLHTLFS